MTNLYCATPSAHSQLSYVFTSIYLFLEGLEITHLFTVEWKQLEQGLINERDLIRVAEQLGRTRQEHYTSRIAGLL